MASNEATTVGEEIGGEVVAGGEFAAEAEEGGEDCEAIPIFHSCKAIKAEIRLRVCLGQRISMTASDYHNSSASEAITWQFFEEGDFDIPKSLASHFSETTGCPLS